MSILFRIEKKYWSGRLQLINVNHKGLGMNSESIVRMK